MSSSNPAVEGRSEGTRVAEETWSRVYNRGREREETEDRRGKGEDAAREAVPAMADCRGSFNVATPVITSALTGDDSLSLFRGFTGSSSAREGPREADTQQGKAAPLSGARMSCKVKSADLRPWFYTSR